MTERSRSLICVLLALALTQRTAVAAGPLSGALRCAHAALLLLLLSVASALRKSHDPVAAPPADPSDPPEFTQAPAA
jgi:hypothetical protein